MLTIHVIKQIIKLQRFEGEKHNVFTEEVNKISLRSNDDKKPQSIDKLETYVYGTSKNLESEKEKIKCNNIIKRRRLTLIMLQKKT